ncbi:FecR family protein [Pectobacterium cacticida]|uniref:FecR family protein n=1 Tax=Pectobacterium cacticida TaxID=69221 RepID=UPI00398827FC
MAPNNFHTSSEDDALETKAIYWLVRLTSGEITQGELKKFNQWRCSNPRHEAALTSALNLWLQIGKPLEAHQRAMLLRSYPSTGYGRRFASLPPRRLISIGFLLLISLMGCYQWMNYWRFSYATRLGEFREVSLNDGSRMWLNTDSAANVDVSAFHRHVMLARGEAFFDVKHDEKIPFTVNAGSGYIRVLGTAFAVKIEGKNTVITSQNGKVSITANTQKTVEIGADQSAVINSAKNTLAVSNVDARSELAWQKGLLIFENSTLHDIVKTLKRYDSKVIYLSPSLSDKFRLSASINTANIDGWFDQLEKVLPIQVRRLGPIIWVQATSAYDAPTAGM